jgi:molybdopterin molybdotransferase
MPEFLTLLSPDEGRALLLSHLKGPTQKSEFINVTSSLNRICAEDIRAPYSLPDFPRSTVDGYAVRARDSYGATDSMPSYLELVGEIPMGKAPTLVLSIGQCALIHTGGMLPKGADAVIMLEYTQATLKGEIEISRAVASGENVISIGEDVLQGQLILPRGSRMRPAEIGGLMAMGIIRMRVINKIRVGLISTGDEVIDPNQSPEPGQVRDINSYTLAALIERTGGQAILYGIVADKLKTLKDVASKALTECEMVIITAGSSASTRDRTAEVIGSLGKPGVLVHGINTRPGKPTILGVCGEKPVIGLPGNPVSALVNGYLFAVPVIESLLGALSRPKATVTARLTVNLPSQAGREDWWPVKLVPVQESRSKKIEGKGMGSSEWNAEPIFGKSNLIFTLAAADGLLCIPPNSTGMSAGELADVLLI